MHRGTCLCESVAFSWEGSSLWSAHCHCSLCQRAHGAAFVTWVGVRESKVAIDDPDHRLTWYRSTPGAERGFCGRCGSTLFFRGERWPGELHIARANIVGDIDREPASHVYHSSHVDWFAFQDALPRKD